MAINQTGMDVVPMVDPFAAFAFLMGFFFIIMIIGIGFYVYSALALVSIARKTKTESEWMAWVPVANMLLMARIAQMSWKPILYVIPAIFLLMVGAILSGLGEVLASTVWGILAALFIMLGGICMLIMSVYIVIWNWRMYERVSRPGYWSLIPTGISIFFMFILFIGLFTASTPVFLLGYILMILGTVISQSIFMGIAAWHNDSTPKNLS